MGSDMYGGDVYGGGKDPYGYDVDTND